MNIQQIYELAVKLGIANDLRGIVKVKKLLVKAKEKYGQLSPEKKKEFDQEKLTNPYSDSRVFVDPGREIKKIMAGIDITPSELLLAKQLGVDLVIAHHPVGNALAGLHDVMHLQADVLSQYGVPINVAESLMKVRISEVARGVNAINHQRTIDMARILGVNFMVSHTPADNLAAKFVKNLLEEKNPEYVGDILKVLKEVPEYKEAMKIGVGPKIFVGSPENRAGKIAVTEFTGGTEGSPKLYEKMSQAGIGTVIAMHTSEEHRKEAEAAHVNIVIAGHMSSDSLGMNQLMDELEKQGIEIVPCSGFTRFKRV